jgi:hypothetical protein
MPDDLPEVEMMLMCHRLARENNAPDGRIIGAIGFFNAIPSPKIAHECYLFVSVSRIMRPVTFALELLHLTLAGAEPTGIKLDVPMAPPLDFRAPQHFHVPLRGLQLPGEGEYVWKLTAGPHWLGARRMYVISKPVR